MDRTTSGGHPITVEQGTITRAEWEKDKLLVEVQTPGSIFTLIFTSEEVDMLRNLTTQVDAVSKQQV